MAKQQITEARALQHLLRCPDWSGMKMFAAVPLSSVVHKTLQHVSLDDYKEDSPVLTGSIPQALPFLEMHWPSLQSRTNSCCQSCTGLLVTHFSTCFQHNFENSKSKISQTLNAQLLQNNWCHWRPDSRDGLAIWSNKISSLLFKAIPSHLITLTVLIIIFNSGVYISDMWGEQMRDVIKMSNSAVDMVLTPSFFVGNSTI